MGPRGSASSQFQAAPQLRGAGRRRRARNPGRRKPGPNWGRGRQQGPILIRMAAALFPFLARISEPSGALTQTILGFKIIASLIPAGKLANPVTMQHLLRADVGFPRGEGPKYLVKLATSTITMSNAPDYAAIVADCAIRRRLIDDLGEPRPN